MQTFVLLLAYLLVSFLSNTDLVVTTYRIPSPAEATRGLRIVQVSDMHGRSFGLMGKRLIPRVKALDPDLVLITGDLVSKSQISWRAVVSTAAALAAEWPVYWIPGNHEVARRDMPEIAAALSAAGVTVLRDQAAAWGEGGERVAIIGMADACGCDESSFNSTMKSLVAAAGNAPLKILMSHRPQLARLYSESGADLVFSGHAHGGQITLPWLGALYSPDEGLWPRYVAGVHRLGRTGESDRDTTLVISRGLGGLWFVPRVGNRPEIVLMELL